MAPCTAVDEHLRHVGGVVHRQRFFRPPVFTRKDHDRDLLARELRAIEWLIERHREEFDAASVPRVALPVGGRRAAGGRDRS